jgi:thiol-disulfide isomerase/thioredoxin
VRWWSSSSSSSINGTPQTSGGKPEMLYIGAEYCPYCAFERWGMVVALSRFGTFKGLSTTHSSSTDVYPNTPTWTFYKSSYTSKYVAFSSVEETTNQLASNGQGYVPLQSPTAAQQALINKYDAPPYVPSADKGAIPFVYIGGKYLISGSSALPSVLSGKSWASIASSLKDPNNTVAKAVDGTANYITAAICKTTGNQPSNVCTSSVTALQSKMPAAG